MRDGRQPHFDSSTPPAQRYCRSATLRSVLDALRVEDREECCREQCPDCEAGLLVARDDRGIPTWCHGSSVCRAQRIREREHQRRERHAND